MNLVAKPALGRLLALRAVEYLKNPPINKTAAQVEGSMA
jgi:hypothetical protein